jgi:hypothetical protein
MEYGRIVATTAGGRQYVVDWKQQQHEIAVVIMVVF